MTAIAPNTTVWLVNTLLTAGSEDTFYFASLADQTAYFEARKLIGLTNYTYQREQRHFIKVGVNGSDMARVIKNANYMMWKNSSYENKNYYAFITEAEWINNEVVKLYFEMDYIQTYFFNYISPSCYLVRQHSETDNIGDNVLPEPVELGEYVITGENKKCIPYGTSDVDLNPCTVIAEVDQSQNGRLVDGVYNHYKFAICSTDQTGIDAADNIIHQHITKPEEILAIYASRYFLVDVGYHSGVVYPSMNSRPIKRSIRVETINSNDTLDNYSPKNKKLFTYPYTFLNVTNCKGSDINLRYEFWNKISGSTYHELIMYTNRGLPNSVQIRPYSYKGETSQSESDGVSTDIFVELSGQPMGSSSIDSYASWAAQNQANIMGTAIKTVTGIAANGIQAANTGNPVNVAGMLTSAVGGAVDVMTASYNASIAADRFSGTVSGSSIQYNNELDWCYYRRMSLQYQYARAIDNFFTMFGYTQNKIARPNRHARTRFTYVRTSGFNPMGNIPQDARRYISARYDAGIRFWVDHESNDFCNYTLDNLPLS